MIKINKLSDYFKNKKAVLILIFCLIIGIILVLSDKKTDNTHDNSSDYTKFIENYTSKIENKLAELIEEVEGASLPKIMITLKSGSEFVYASDGKESNEKHVVVDDNLVYVKEYLPQIEGVAIVCKGGNDPAVKSKITELVCSVLGLYSSHVYVTE